MRCRYDTERNVVLFANVLLVLVEGEWRTVELFDSRDPRRGISHIFGVDQDRVREDDRAMASVRRTQRSAAGRAIDAATDAELDRVLAGEKSRYPNGVLFVPADLVTSAGLDRELAEHPLVVVMDEHGEERWLTGHTKPEDWDYG